MTPTIRERLREPVIGHDQKHDGIAPVFDWRGVCLVCSICRERDAERARTVVLTDALRRAQGIARQRHAPGVHNNLQLDLIEEVARAALAVLPVDRVGVDHDTDIDGAHWNGCPGCAADRVGVEPLDVAEERS